MHAVPTQRRNRAGPLGSPVPVAARTQRGGSAHALPRVPAGWLRTRTSCRAARRRARLAMALTGVMYNALSGINVAQEGLRNTSNNITNVNTEGYDRRIQIQESRLLGTQGAGVEVAEIRRIVDEFLAKQLLTARADAERYEIQNTLSLRLQALLGSPTQNSTITGRLDTLFASLGTLAIEPDSAVRREGVVTDIQAWADDVSRLSSQIQDLRQDADRRIGTAVNDMNAQIARIHDLNVQISRETNIGTDTSSLEEQRDDALSILAKYVDVRTFDQGNGFLGVTAASGIVLVDTNIRQLDYSLLGTVSTQTNFQQILVKKVVPGTTEVTGTGQPLDPNRSSGALDGLLEMRDEILPAFAISLGQLAGAVVDQLNAVHNDNSAVPPPSSMIGRNTGLVATDELNFTGAVTLAAIDSANDIDAVVVIDFDAGTVNGNAIGGTTLAALVAAVNTEFGGGEATLNLTGGLLTFAAGTSSGVALLQDSTSPSDRAGRGFAHFFGLNDLLTAGDDHSLTAGGSTTLQLRGPAGQVVVEFDLAVANIDARGTTWKAMLDELNAAASMGSFVTFSLDSSGALVATPISQYSGYSVVVTADATQRGATQVPLSDLFGIGNSYGMDAARFVQVVDDILEAPSLMALGKLDTSADALAGTFPALTPGDSQGAINLQAVEGTSVAFQAAGHLASINSSLSEYSGSVLTDFSNTGAIIEQFAEDRLQIVEALHQRVSDISGVNLDEELANMILYQNAFSAAARIIATVQEMFDALLAAV